MQITWKQRIGAVAGNAVEYYDIAVYTAISVYLTNIFNTDGIHHSAMVVWGLFALRFLLRPLGGYVIGRYADRHGRKAALVLTSGLTGIATLGMVCIPVHSLGHWVVLVFLLFQVMQAFSFAGEYPILMHYLLKDCEPKITARVSSLIVASSIVGVLASLLLVFGLKEFLTQDQMLAWGWRIPLLAGMINIAISYWFRTHLPEDMTKIKLEINYSNSVIFQVLLVTIPGSIMFYVQNLASGIVGKALHINNFSLLNSSILLVLVLLFGYLSDKYSSSLNAYKIGVGLLITFAIPLYCLLGSQNIMLAELGTVAFSIIAAIILANLSTAVWKVCKDNGIALGLGYNIASAIFGGLTPLIMSSFMGIEKGFLFAGVYLTVFAIPAAFVLFGKNKQLSFVMG